MLAAGAAAGLLVLARAVRGFFFLAAVALVLGGVFLVVYSREYDGYFGSREITRWDWGGTGGRPTFGVAMALTGLAIVLLLAAWKRASGTVVRLGVVVTLAAVAAQVAAAGALSIGH